MCPPPSSRGPAWEGEGLVAEGGVGSGSPSGAGDGDGGGRRDRLWPTLIVVGFVLVILVNAIFIYIAVKGADDVVPSYQTEER